MNRIQYFERRIERKIKLELLENRQAKQSAKCMVVPVTRRRSQMHRQYKESPSNGNPTLPERYPKAKKGVNRDR